MKDEARYRWIADHVLPFERQVRLWLRHKVRSLSGADLDDLIQEGYARLLHANLSLVTDGPGFLCSTIFNLWLDQRRRSRVVPIDLLENVDPERIDEAPDPERRASARQQYERLVQAMQQLPEQQRIAFEFKQFAGLQVREIAERMAINEKTVEMHLRLALVQVTRLILGEEEMGHRAGEGSELCDHETARKQD